MMSKKTIASKLDEISHLLNSIIKPEIHSAITTLLNLVESLTQENEEKNQTCSLLTYDL